MYNFRRLALILLLSISSLIAVGQKNFQDGRIILAGKDTLTGQIDFRDWSVSPESIHFMDKQTGNTAIYTPDQIMAFEVYGETYTSLPVLIYPYSPDAVFISEGKLSQTPYRKTVFMRLVTKGKIALYAYKDSLSVNYFFVRRGEDSAEQLRIRSQYIENGEHSGVTFDEIYQRQLPAYLSDCDQSARQAARVAYSEPALKKLIFSYNNCGKDTSDQTEVQKNKGSVRVSLILGGFSSKVTFTGANSDLSRINFPAYNSVCFGAGVQILIPRCLGRLFLNTNLVYNHFYSQGSDYKATSLLTESGTLDYSVLKWDILLKYQYASCRFKPFFEAGPSADLVLSNKSMQVLYDQINTTMYSPFFGQESAFRKVQFGVSAGTGIRSDRYSLEFKFNLSEGMSDALSTASPVRSFYLLAGFTL